MKLIIKIVAFCLIVFTGLSCTNKGQDEKRYVLSFPLLAECKSRLSSVFAKYDVDYSMKTFDANINAFEHIVGVVDVWTSKSLPHLESAIFELQLDCYPIASKEIGQNALNLDPVTKAYVSRFQHIYVTLINGEITLYHRNE